jgi:hypothetical protein
VIESWISVFRDIVPTFLIRIAEDFHVAMFMHFGRGHDRDVDRVMTHNVIDRRVNVMGDIMHMSFICIWVGFVIIKLKFRDVNTARGYVSWWQVRT